MGYKIFALSIENSNISETIEDAVKVTINSLHKVIDDLSIGSKMYDLE